ncbi:MAG: diguanylate cyclase, partial [Pseudomonadota bacterium]
MDEYSNIMKALNIIDCAMLKRLGKGRFSTLHADGAWFTKLLPEATTKIFDIADSSPFLVDFLIDAEVIWSGDEDGKKYSGIWSEESISPDGGKQALRLEAIAAKINHECYLVISNVKQEYERQRSTLQIARELQISHDEMQAEHDYLIKRLASLLERNENLIDLHAPVQQAIKHSTVAIIITDASDKVLFFNKALEDLFETSMSPDGYQPLEIINSLMHKQYPEFHDGKQKQKQFSGELYWHNPPVFHKWIQTSASPVFNDIQELTHWVYTLTDNTRIKYLLESNENMALHDALTGLPNRQYFWQTLEHKIRRQDPLYLLYLDVQHFKRINELYGHSAGDHILIQAAKRIKDFTAEQDFVARIGADEFAIIRLCNNSNDEKYNKQSCEKFADALLNAFIQPLYTNKQEGCTLAINIGIAHYPNHALQAETLVKNADIALGEARLPENPSRKFFSSALQKNVEEKLELETQLRKAITDGNFDIYLQPILDLNTESVVKAEALLRWQVRDEVFVSPDVFIPLAE